MIPSREEFERERRGGTTLRSGVTKTMLVLVKARIDRRTVTLVADEVYIWPNGYVTVYTDAKDSEAWEMYPPGRVLSIRTEAQDAR